MFLKKKPLYNKPLKILVATNAIILTAAAMFGPIYALFVEEIGGNLMDASLTGAIFALAAGVTVLISGKLSDKIKHPERVVIFGYLVMGLGFLLYTTVSSIWALFAIQALIGFGEAVYSPPFDALYSKNLNQKKAGSQWALWESMNYFTIVIGAAFGGLIATTLGFNALFVIMAFLCFTSATYIALLPKNTL
jgi:MFS family permease